MAVTPLEEWIRFLKTEVIDDDTTTACLVEAKEKLKYYNMNDAERREYEAYLSEIMIQNDVLGNARREGRAEGHAEGKYEQKLEIAKNLKDKGMEITTIIEITKFSVEEIVKL